MKVFLLLLCVSVSLHAMPAKDTPTVMQQPDGTTFSIVGFGDEYYNLAETVDGYVVVQGVDGWWYYAELTPSGRFIASAMRVGASAGAPEGLSSANVQKHLREALHVVREKMRSYTIDPQSNNAGGVKNRPHFLKKAQGAVNRILILCVAFPDTVKTYTSQSFQDLVNDDQWNGGTGGVSRYYKEVSYNALSLQADHREWITAAHPLLYYAYNGSSYTTRIRELVAQCVNDAEANGVDFSQYDNDGDGAVDGLFIVHAGKSAEEGNDLRYIWSHAGSIPALTYDGVTINRYVMLPEKNLGRHAAIGVFCHEYGHILGLPDLYDTDGTTNGVSEGLGTWCLMSSGSWGGDGNTPDTPVHMSAYCKERLGFAVPAVVQASEVLSVPQCETQPSVYKVWLDKNQADEYMLIENRQRTGFDVNLPASGLLLVHIDRCLTEMWPARNKVNVTKAHLGVKLYEADGLEELANGVNRGNAGDPYPGSSGNTSLTPSSSPNSNTWYTLQSGVSITDISSSSAVMTATAVLPTYYGYGVQFYRTYVGWGHGNSEVPSGYGMVECLPSRNGKLAGVRVCSYANFFRTISASAFSILNENVLSSQIGGTAEGASASVDNTVQLNFSPAIDVTKDVPVYVRVYFERFSGGYAVPIDITLPVTGKSYFSWDGEHFDQLPNDDIAMRVVFESESPMPVELTSFTASSHEGTVRLAWQTATEHDNYGFEVERKSGGGFPLPTRPTAPNIGDDWTTIGFCEGGGTSNSPRSYAFIDKPGAGTFSYRLKQIDRAGAFFYSAAVRAEAAPVPIAFGLLQNYPNPFNPSTQISFALATPEPATLDVYDLMGRHVATLFNGMAEGQTVYTLRFEGAFYASGLYFYRLTTPTRTELKTMHLVK